jgi:menaquinone-dependent protoporphyrinogen oxidase
MGSVLVAYATKYGSTKEVAEAVAAALNERGMEVELKAAGDVENLAGYSAVVFGTAIYFPRPIREGRRFLSRHHDALAHAPFAAFALGPIKDAPEDFAGVRKQFDSSLAKHPDLKPAAVAIFGGVMDPETLKFPFNNPGMRAQGPSDIRDWDAIKETAEGLQGALGLGESEKGCAS